MAQRHLGIEPATLKPSSLTAMRHCCSGGKGGGLHLYLHLDPFSCWMSHNYLPHKTLLTLLEFHLKPAQTGLSLRGVSNTPSSV